MINPTAEKARGQWHTILPALGISREHLKNRHGPCPLCGGKDRFRYDNMNGSGTFYCNSCGAGDGFRLVQLYNGWSFKDAATEVDNFLGHNPKPEHQQVDLEDQKRIEFLRRLWVNSWPSREGDYTDGYLKSRKLFLPKRGLRTARSIRGMDGNDYPAMLGEVSDANGKITSLHRTFLNPMAPGKAETGTQRAIVRGTVPDGSAIRLFGHGETLGVAEGIETALSAARIFRVPTWSTINTSLMRKFVVPSGVKKLFVFADHDESYAGHAAAYELAARACAAARRNGVEDFEVDVQVAPDVGMDWADY